MNTTKVEKSSGQFEKGHEKTGGRKKGTPNKKTLLFIDELGCFKTINELISLYESTDDEHIKFAILKEFLKYQYPQRKAIDITPNEFPLPVIKIEGIKI